MERLGELFDAEAAAEVAAEKRYAGPVERRRREEEVEAALLAETDPDYEIRLRERRAREVVRLEISAEAERFEADREKARREARAFELREERRILYNRAIEDSWERQRERDGIPAGTEDDPTAGDVLADVLEDLGVDEDIGVEAARFFDLAVEQIAIRIAERVADKLRGELTRGIATGTQAAVEQVLDADANRLARAARRRTDMKEWGYETDPVKAENEEIMLETEQ